jgi:hypothetical protein
MLDGEEIATVASMTAALTADEVAKKANAEAERQLEIFSSGNAGEIGRSIYEATGDLGELNLEQIDKYKELLGDKISEELN